MSANCAPRLSQLICAATPDLVDVEKAALKARFVAASAALVAEAKCLLDDKEELWEEKVMWMHRWEQKTGEVFPLVEHGSNREDVAHQGGVLASLEESKDEDELKIVVPPGSILHKGCKKLTKATGKKVQAGTSVTQSSKAAKAGLSKRAADDDNDEVEVVKGHSHMKGKAPVQGGLDSKVAANLLQFL
ncbi:hypothetical protein F5J12DRAFT_890512 [Pisolithus orientalis]|uniref:uncharacterized protein n=1 Tax=Pisolithus orientalis TaxID=936130 RepID=UPI00222558C9|nr:uncharacterized protein F5J12DRAFT_890512 [Pisolithus orientalis]KAI6015153.1 hypothetical protein F5J12DRAFT_890512 [Pisolithus orientalis]